MPDGVDWTGQVRRPHRPERHGLVRQELDPAADLGTLEAGAKVGALEARPQQADVQGWGWILEAQHQDVGASGEPDRDVTEDRLEGA